MDNKLVHKVLYSIFVPLMVILHLWKGELTIFLAILNEELDLWAFKLIHVKNFHTVVFFVKLLKIDWIIQKKIKINKLN